jgi:hypothetical protein
MGGCKQEQENYADRLAHGLVSWKVGRTHNEHGPGHVKPVLAVDGLFDWPHGFEPEYEMSRQ